MNENKLHYYTLICDRKDKKKYIEFLSDCGAVGINVIYGKGSANAGALAKAFGFESEEQKAVIFCLITSDKAQLLTEALCTEHGFSRENTGIAFSVPVEGLVF